MSSGLPFGELLESLRRHGLAVGVRESELFYRLLARWQGSSLGELRDAIAALLARDPTEIALIRRLFDEFRPVEVPPPSPVVRRRWWWVLALAVALAAGGVIARRLWRAPGDKPSEAQDGPVPPPPPLPPQPLPLLLAPPLEQSTQAGRRWPDSLDEARWLFVLMAGGAGVALLGLSLLRRRQGRASRTRALRGERLARVTGPQNFRITVPAYRGFACEDLDDLATWLGRISSERLPSRQLDVDRAVAASAARGQPVLVYAPRPPGQPLVVLDDIGPEMRVWRRKVDAFVQGLERRGVAIERWYFDADARVVSRRPHGEPVPLSVLLARAEETALLVISAGTGVLDEARALRGWVRTLAQFPRRVWLHPVADPELWRPGLARAPLPVFAMDRPGFARAARVLGADVPDVATKARQPARTADENDLQQLRALAALVPQARPELIMSLRETFLAHVPEETILLLLEERGAWGAGGLDWGRRQRASVVARLSAQEPIREELVRRHLLDLLGASEPPRGSGAHLRWRLARAEQAAFLARDAEMDPVRRELTDLAGSAISEETADLLAVLGAKPGAAPATERRRRRLARSARRDARLEPLARPGGPLGRLRPADYVRALCVGAAIAGGGLALRPPATSLLVRVTDEEKGQVLGGARLVLDGRELRGGGPMTIAAGSHTVQITAPAHQPRTHTFEVAPGRRTVLDVSMRRDGYVPPTLSLNLQIPSGLQPTDVLINGVPWTGEEFLAPVGARIDVTIRHPYYDYSRVFRADRQQLILRVEATPRFGALRVDCACKPESYTISPSLESHLSGGRLTFG